MVLVKEPLHLLHRCGALGDGLVREEVVIVHLREKLFASKSRRLQLLWTLLLYCHPDGDIGAVRTNTCGVHTAGLTSVGHHWRWRPTKFQVTVGHKDLLFYEQWRQV